jgi:hypothetical protein
MTERARIEHEFHCSEEVFLGLFLKEAYNKALFEGHLKFPMWRVSSEEETPERITRTIEVEPFVADLPAAIQKVVGNNLRYREEAYYDKILVSGVQLTESLGPGRCKRIFLADVEVKIFGVGGLIEKRIVQDLIKSYDIGKHFTDNYLIEHGLAGT